MSRLAFGIFDFDPETNELRRNELPVKLQAQPARVLAALLTNAGEVVTRESLREAVWKGETFVDFERGLNFCIAQVRSALGDSAESPRFVRTLPKKGYQFIAPVRVAGVPVTVPQARSPNRRMIFALALAAALIVASGFIWRGIAPHSAPISVAVARFDNQTGRAAEDLLADQITDLLVTELASTGAGRYGVIGNAAELRVPRQQRDPNKIAAALNTGYLVVGQVQPEGDGELVIASLIRMPEQTHIGVRRVTVGAGGVSQREGARLIAERFNGVLRQEADGHRVSPLPSKH